MSTNLLAPATTMTPQILNSGYLATSDASIYAAPSVSTVKIETATICNVTTSDAIVYIDLVPSGGTAGVTHRVVHNYTLLAGNTQSVPGLVGAVLTAADFVAGFCGTGSAVVLVLTGVVTS